jgi:hypothetical protein
MSGNGYRGGPTAEGMWACLAGTSVSIPVFMVLILANTLGNYGNGERPSILLNAFLPSAAVGVGVSATVWLLMRWIRRNGG